MSTVARLKQLSKRLGVYASAREVYRTFSPLVRAQNAGGLKIYGQFISPGDLVFDIGANLGQKSEVFLKLGARVVALEPNPHCVAMLGRSLGAKPGFTLLQCAAGAAEGEMALHYSGTNPTGSLRQDWFGHALTGGATESAAVRVTTLDRMIAEHGLPAFCKIDVEGFEEEVLKGLSAPIPVISLEFHRKESGRALACIERLAQIGDITLNCISMNGGEFLLPAWLGPESFRDWLSGREAPGAGDLFARISSPRTCRN